VAGGNPFDSKGGGNYGQKGDTADLGHLSWQGVSVAAGRGEMKLAGLGRGCEVYGGLQVVGQPGGWRLENTVMGCNSHSKGLGKHWKISFKDYTG
jgi:hypothetical protein